MKAYRGKWFWKTYLPGEEAELERAIAGSNLIVVTDLGYVNERYLQENELEESDLTEEELREYHEATDSLKRVLVLFTTRRKGDSRARVVISVDEYDEVVSISGREAGGYLPEDEFLPLIEEKLNELGKEVGSWVLDDLEACKKMAEIYSKQKAGDTKLSKAQAEALYEIHEELDIGADVDEDRRVYAARRFFAQQAKKDGYLTDAQEKLLQLVYGGRFNCQPDYDKIGKNIMRFAEPGCNINLALRHINRKLDADELNHLLENGRASVPLLISKSSTEAINQNFEKIAALKDAEAIDYAVGYLPTSYVEKNLKRLASLGTPGVIVNKMARRVSRSFLEKSLKQFLKLGADPKELLCDRFLAREIVARNFSLFLKYGVKIEEAVKFLDSKTVAKNLEKLLNAGVSAEQAVTLMRSQDIVLKIASLRERGLNDAVIVDALSYDFMYKHFSALREKTGIHVNLLLEKLDAKTVSSNLKYLLKNGATIEALSKKLPVDLKTKRHLVVMYSTEPKKVIQEWLDAVEAEDRDEDIKDFIEEEKYLESAAEAEDRDEDMEDDDERYFESSDSDYYEEEDDDNM